jgi:UDP-3-O-[3-hydroxymyristoyl] glucosamine N-acyltransferase
LKYFINFKNDIKIMDTTTTTTADDEEKTKIQVEIHPDAIVAAKAILQGNIFIGQGTVIHPQV